MDQGDVPPRALLLSATTSQSWSSQGPTCDGEPRTAAAKSVRAGGASLGSPGTRSSTVQSGVCGHLTWAELSGKALGQPASLSQLPSQALPLGMLSAIMDEEGFQVLNEQLGNLFPFPQLLI